MTVVLKGEDPLGRTATNDRGERAYTRVFRLETTALTDTAYAVGSALGLPVISSTHPGDANAYCNKLDVKCVAGWKEWTVTAHYSTERVLNAVATSDPARITWETEQFQRVAIADKDDNAITNSAGEYFDPMPTIDDSRRVVTVEKNLTTVPTWILDYQDAVNSDTFTIDGVSITAGKAKMQRVSVGPVERRNTTAFRNVRFTIALQRDGWDLSLLDIGYTQKNATDPDKREQITMDDGTDPKLPFLLDGNGRKLDNPSPTTAVYRTFAVYKTRAFSTLPLT
jgi:hypothetical protein